jgi:heparosan-N-sulfate-glucuronate 5-epimerase
MSAKVIASGLRTFRNAWASTLSRGATYERQTPGSRWTEESVAGYFVDFCEKTWAPGARDLDSLQPVSLAQLALGWWERHLEGDAQAGARFEAIAELLARQAVRVGSELRWPFRVAVPKYGLGTGWCSAMAQGQVASVFVRQHLRTGADSWGDCALGALRPLLGKSELVSLTREGRILEEAPTDPPSHILNGWIYALWGLWDAAVGLQDADAAGAFGAGVATLRTMLPSYDVGWWTRYSLYPHVLIDLAKPFYHRIHVLQLEVTARATGHSDIAAMAERWRGYDRAPNRVAAVTQKGAFVVARTLAR